VPYCDLSFRGHLTDSARAQFNWCAAHEEDREQDALLGADPAAPYFELSLPGSLRV